MIHVAIVIVQGL